MAYEPVTSADFLARFPQFASADPDYIDILLAEAATQVDDTWLEADFKTATLYLTAHLYTSEPASRGDATRGPVLSESIGSRLSFSYANMSKSGLRSTEFGRRFDDLRRKNFPGVTVV